MEATDSWDSLYETLRKECPPQNKTYKHDTKLA